MVCEGLSSISHLWAKWSRWVEVWWRSTIADCGRIQFSKSHSLVGLRWYSATKSNFHLQYGVLRFKAESDHLLFGWPDLCLKPSNRWVDGFEPEESSNHLQACCLGLYVLWSWEGSGNIVRWWFGDQSIRRSSHMVFRLWEQWLESFWGKETASTSMQCTNCLRCGNPNHVYVWRLWPKCRLEWYMGFWL